MERVPVAAYIRATLMGLALLVIGSVGVYFAGYVLLAGEHGIYPNQTIFELYQPAIRAQAWITGQRVSTGFVDSLGRRRAMQLQIPSARLSLHARPQQQVPPLQQMPTVQGVPAAPPSAAD